MKKQTQSRQYGYVSPKCKFVKLTQDVGFCQSPQYDSNTGIIQIPDINDESDNNHSGNWGW